LTKELYIKKQIQRALALGIGRIEHEFRQLENVAGLEVLLAELDDDKFELTMQIPLDIDSSVLEGKQAFASFTFRGTSGNLEDVEVVVLLAPSMMQDSSILVLVS
jgi:hypothetical protein